MGAMAVLTERKTWRRARPPGADARRSACVLSPDEQANVRRALRFLAKRMGGWGKLARAMGSPKKTVYAALKRAVSPGVALGAARIAWEPVEALLSGAWPAPGACPHCGRI